MGGSRGLPPVHAFPARRHSKTTIQRISTFGASTSASRRPRKGNLVRLHPAWLAVPVLLLGTAAPAADATGTVAGVVRCTGRVPAPKKVQTNDGTLLHCDLVVDGKTK